MFPQKKTEFQARLTLLAKQKFHRGEECRRFAPKCRKRSQASSNNLKNGPLQLALAICGLISPTIAITVAPPTTPALTLDRIEDMFSPEPAASDIAAAAPPDVTRKLAGEIPSSKLRDGKQ